MIERLQDKHLEGVAALETLCFSAPWSKDSLAFLLQDGNFGFVWTVDDSPVAYAGLVRAVDEGDITNVATHPDHRGRGYAKAVLSALLAEAKAVGLVRLFLEVRASNAPALALYRSLGFRECGRRKNFYTLPREDALLMEKIL